MATPDRVSYWNKTRNLMFFMLGLCGSSSGT